MSTVEYLQFSYVSWTRIKSHRIGHKSRKRMRMWAYLCINSNLPTPLQRWVIALAPSLSEVHSTILTCCMSARVSVVWNAVSCSSSQYCTAARCCSNPWQSMREWTTPGPHADSLRKSKREDDGRKLENLQLASVRVIRCTFPENLEPS